MANFNTKAVKKWSNNDVHDWLSSYFVEDGFDLISVFIASFIVDENKMDGKQLMNLYPNNFIDLIPNWVNNKNKIHIKLLKAFKRALYNEPKSQKNVKIHRIKKQESKWHRNSRIIDKYKIINSGYDTEFLSSNFILEGINFFLGCTPNGCSKANKREGNTTFWLGLSKLPNNIHSIDVEFKFVINELGYNQNRRVIMNRDDIWSSWSIKSIKRKEFKRLETQFSIHFHIKIHNKNKIDDIKILRDDMDSVEDSESKEICDMTHIPLNVKSTKKYWKQELILTYYYGKNEYIFDINPVKLASGHFKDAYQATLIKQNRTTQSSPIFKIGTEVVLKIRKDGPVMKRSEWNKDLNELDRLSKYTNKWNNGGYSDKKYYASKACVLKVSNKSKHGTCMFKKDEYILVESFLPKFNKWNWPKQAESDARALSVQAFTHFTYHESNETELVTDAQGYRDNNKYIMTDPFYLDINNNKNHKNICLQWFNDHQCNQFCQSYWKRPRNIKKKYYNSNDSPYIYVPPLSNKVVCIHACIYDIILSSNNNDNTYKYIETNSIWLIQCILIPSIYNDVCHALYILKQHIKSHTYIYT